MKGMKETNTKFNLISFISDDYVLDEIGIDVYYLETKQKSIVYSVSSFYGDVDSSTIEHIITSLKDDSYSPIYFTSDMAVAHIAVEHYVTTLRAIMIENFQLLQR